MKTRYGIVFLIPLLSILILLTRCSGKKVQAEAMEPAAAPVPHPFDPLGESEIRTVKQVLLAEKKIDTTYRFFVINLKEPAKADMLNYKPGDTFQRQAFAVLYDWNTNKTFEAVVDLTAKKVKSFEYIAGVTAGGMAGDTLVDKLLKSDPAWMEGLKKRNIHPDSIKTSYVFAGEMGMAPADHREMICTPQYITRSITSF